MTLLQLRGVAKRFGARSVLEGLDLQVGRGEIYGLLGPNGSGKTTALHIVCRLLAADEGETWLGGKPMAASDAAVASRIGLCPQQPALYRDLLPAENLDFFARVHGLSGAARRARVAELMAQFDLLAHAGTPVSRLSEGWTQRLSLAVALVHRPELLILDEPAAAVDVLARHALWAQVEALRAAGTTILLTTHLLSEAEHLCTRVGILRAGRIGAEGTPAELRARVPAHAVALLQAGDAAAVATRAGQLGWPLRRYGGQTACLLPHAATLREVVEAFEGTEVNSVALQPVTLEHAYLEVLGDPAPSLG